MERTADSASLWVLATSTSRQAQLSYAKALSGTMKHSGFDNQPLKSLASALRAAGAAVPLKQASPMLKEDLLMWVDQEGDPHLRLAGLVAWKTCSRWGEVHQLTSAQFILVTPADEMGWDGIGGGGANVFFVLWCFVGTTFFFCSIFRNTERPEQEVKKGGLKEGKKMWERWGRGLKNICTRKGWDGRKWEERRMELWTCTRKAGCVCGRVEGVGGCGKGSG